MFNHGVLRSIYVVCIVGLLAVFSIALQVSPTSLPTAFSQVVKMNVCAHVKCVKKPPRHRIEIAGVSTTRLAQIDAKQPYSQLRTVDH